MFEHPGVHDQLPLAVGSSILWFFRRRQEDADELSVVVNLKYNYYSVRIMLPHCHGYRFQFYTA